MHLIEKRLFEGRDKWSLKPGAARWACSLKTGSVIRQAFSNHSQTNEPSAIFCSDDKFNAPTLKNPKFNLFFSFSGCTYHTSFHFLYCHIMGYGWAVYGADDKWLLGETQGTRARFDKQPFCLQSTQHGCLCSRLSRSGENADKRMQKTYEHHIQTCIISNENSSAFQTSHKHLSGFPAWKWVILFNLQCKNKSGFSSPNQSREISAK